MEKIKLSPIISDGMVIQKEAPFPVWSSNKLNVSFLNKTYISNEENGKWLLTLDPAKAGGPYEMVFSCEDETLKINDIYIGDIWLCSGQSNMEMEMNRLKDDFSEEWNFDNSKLPVIRHFKVTQGFDFSHPQDDISGGEWIAASTDTLDRFSGTAWFFAKEMYNKYGIPIGLINTAWGGTPVESWMSEDALKEFPNKIMEGKQYSSLKRREEVINIANNAISEWENNLNEKDEGIKQNWHNSDTDISQWSPITLPCDFTEAGIENFNGVIWFAKDFDVPSDFKLKNAEVWLGTIIDADTVYINGKEIGSTGYRYPPRKYKINDVIKKGINRITVRVKCNNGEGGFTKDKLFCILSDNESIELSGSWKYKNAAVTSVRPSEFFFQRYPMGNFNVIIAPLLKYAFKGVIWYQGESNGENSHEYAQLFKLMIQDWRIKNNRNNPGNELPFLFVQLPIFCPLSDNNEKDSWPKIREAQADALSLPVTGMAVTLEYGEWNDLHPINKKGVGLRLFLAAEKVVFGVKNTSPGAIIQQIETKEQKILIYFDNCGEGLYIKSPPNSLCASSSLREEISNTAYVSIVNDEGIFRVPAIIEKPNVLSIDISNIKNPQRILYAWADNPRDMQIFNSEGIPVIPFKINI